MSAALRWTPAEDEQMRLMAASGHTKQDVADALGRTINAVAARAIMIRVKRRCVTRFGCGLRTVSDMLRRRCLRCRELFDDDSKYIFLCNVCRATEEWRCYDLEPM